MALKPGTRLKNRYEIIRTLGEGGFGISYQALDHLTNRFVAIKSSEQSLAHEAGVLKRLENVPHISHLYEYFVLDGKHYIVMRLIRGISLSAYCKEVGGKLNINDIKRLLPSVVITLEQMHDKGIIHRDISPGNFILAGEDSLYLIDFGAATSIREKSLKNRFTYRHKGLDSPEANEPDRQGPWTDVYSLCSMIVYLLTGEGIPKLEDRRILDRVPQILMGISLSRKMQNALLKGLTPDRERRYLSVKAFADDFLGSVPEGLDFFDKFSVHYHARTCIGKRAVNQDNFMIDTALAYVWEDCEVRGDIACGLSEYHVVALADGVAGTHHAELASRAAMQAVSHFIDQKRSDPGLAENLVEELLLQINEKILVLSEKIGPTATTLSLLLWKNDDYCVANIGDSPIYLLRGKELLHLSREHTVVNEKLEQNRPISAADLHRLTRYVGKPMTAGSDMAFISTGKLRKGDVFLLCTDGVANSLSEEQKKKYMKKDTETAMKKLFALCNNSLHMDNCTAILLKW